MKRLLASLAIALTLASCSDSIPQPDREAMVRSDLATIVAALEAFRDVHGTLPQALEPLVHPDGEGHHFLPAGTAAIYDPWGHPYVYERTDGGYRLRCLGADGAPGGGGADRDVDAAELAAESPAAR